MPLKLSQILSGGVLPSDPKPLTQLARPSKTPPLIPLAHPQTHKQPDKHIHQSTYPSSKNTPPSQHRSPTNSPLPISWVDPPHRDPRPSTPSHGSLRNSRPGYVPLWTF